jgi:hypothetical protein
LVYQRDPRSTQLTCDEVGWIDFRIPLDSGAGYARLAGRVKV